MGHERSLALRAEVVEKEMEPDSKVAGSLFHSLTKQYNTRIPSILNYAIINYGSPARLY